MDGTSKSPTLVSLPLRMRFDVISAKKRSTRFSVAAVLTAAAIVAAFEDTSPLRRSSSRPVAASRVVVADPEIWADTRARILAKPAQAATQIPLTAPATATR